MTSSVRPAARLLHRINVPGTAAARYALAVFIAFASMLITVPAQAQEDDTPTRVGRVADVGGQVFYSPENDPSEWQGIGVNYPIAGGANLWVSPDGRAEVDFGGSQLRLGGDANVHVSRLDGQQLALFVAQGAAIVRVRVLDPGDSARIDTPNTQIALTRPGLYRIEVAPDRETTSLIVREGEAEVALASGVQQVLPGQTAQVRGAQPTLIDVRNGAGGDGFDAWNVARDRYYEQGRAPAYVSGQMVGGADLSRYGTWDAAPDYGPIWYPNNVAPDWAPYSDGYWTSLPTFGLTWVDAAPWGYAPFHYGRWVSWNGRWGWCPGTYVARPLWAPALVAWYGGPGWGISASVGAPAYGWTPLGWREAYVPAWRHCDAGCYSGYNRQYAVNLLERERSRFPQTYVNAHIPGGFIAVTAGTFAAGKPIAANRLSVPPAAFNGAPVLASAPQVKPATAPAHIVRAGAGAPFPASVANPQTPIVAGAAPRPWTQTLPPRIANPTENLSARPSSVPPGAMPAATMTRSPTTPAPTSPAPPRTSVPVVSAPPSALPPVPARAAPIAVAPNTSAPAMPVRVAPVAVPGQTSPGMVVPSPPRQAYAPVMRPPATVQNREASRVASAPPVQMPPPQSRIQPAAVAAPPAQYAAAPAPAHAQAQTRGEAEIQRHPTPAPKAASN